MVLVTTMQTAPLMLLVDPPSRAVVSAAELRAWENAMHEASQAATNSSAVSGPWAKIMRCLDKAPCKRVANPALPAPKPTDESPSEIADGLHPGPIDCPNAEEFLAVTLAASVSTSGNDTPRCEVARHDAVGTSTEWARVLGQRRERASSYAGASDWGFPSAPRTPCEELSWSDVKAESCLTKVAIPHVDEGSLC
jgi:hypothetical protein